MCDLRPEPLDTAQMLDSVKNILQLMAIISSIAHEYNRQPILPDMYSAAMTAFRRGEIDQSQYFAIIDALDRRQREASAHNPLVNITRLLEGGR